MFKLKSKIIEITHWSKFFILMFILMLLQLSNGLFFLIGYSNYINNQLTQEIIEYDEINSYHLCKLSQCKEIHFKGVENNYYKMENNKLIKVEKEQDFLKYLKLNEDVSMVYPFDFLIYNKDSNLYFLLDTSIIESVVIKYGILFNGVVLFLYIILTHYNIQKEREEAIKQISLNEVTLSNKSMILITENIHHELNTPLDVMESKINKIEDKLKDTEYENIFKNDFKMIHQSNEQIYAVMEKMRSFKHLKYSNGNKNLFEIIEGAFKILSISNTNFVYNISPEFKNYKLDHKYNILNADLLNVLINSIKNSLEAYSNNIKIIFDDYNDNKVYFRIADNGKGIPEKFIKKIFHPNSSTKEIIGDRNVRGNGLYLNKSILQNGNGDLELITTSNKGTIFGLCLNVLPIDNTIINNNQCELLTNYNSENV